MTRLSFRAVLLSASLVLVATGCEKKDEAGKDKAAEKDKRADKKEGNEANDNPPPPANKGFDEATLKAVTEIVPKGYKHQMKPNKPSMGQAMSMLVQEAELEGGGKLGATVIVGNCTPFICKAMDKAVWERNKDTLPHTQMWSPAIKAADKTYEIVEVDLDGKKAIGAYTFAWVKTERPSGTSKTGTHSFVLYFNDGGKHANISVQMQGRSLGTSADAYRGTIDRAALEKEAKALAAPYIAKF